MDTLGSVLASGISPQLTKRFDVESAILDLWSAAARGETSPSGGPAILPRHLAENCTPAMLVKGVLTVECRSPSYLYDLRWEKRNVLVRLQRDLALRRARLRERVGSKVYKLNLVLEGHV